MANVDLLKIVSGYSKFAQLPPPAPPAAAPPGMPGALPPAPGGPPAPMAAPGAPAAPGAAPGTVDEAQQHHITGPLDGLIKILFDADITELVQNGANKSPGNLALKIWTDYGGTADGDTDDSHQGTRDPDNTDIENDPEKSKQEYDQTKHQKWLRLPMGETIGDITTLDELTNSIQGFISSSTKNMAKQNAAPPGGGGGMPPMASAKLMQIRLAGLLDTVGAYKQADFMQNMACK